MHITKKISSSMKEMFDPSKCSYIQKITLCSYSESGIDIIITFVYNHDLQVLNLLFKDVILFELTRDTAPFNIGELLFYDTEDCSPLVVADELGGLSITCSDIVFISIEEMKEDWVHYVGV